jgi:hypothetical protein
MGPYATHLSVAALCAAQEASDARLQAARESFPDHRIVEVAGGGYLAVPAGSVIAQSPDLDEVVMKLRMAPVATAGRTWQRVKNASTWAVFAGGVAVAMMLLALDTARLMILGCLSGLRRR